MKRRQPSAISRQISCMFTCMNGILLRSPSLSASRLIGPLPQTAATSALTLVAVAVLAFPMPAGFVEPGFVLELDDLARFDVLPLLDHLVLDRGRIISARRAAGFHGVLGALGLAVEIGARGEQNLRREVIFDAGMSGSLDVEAPEARHVEALNLRVGIELLADQILKNLARVVVRRLAAEQAERARWRGRENEGGCDRSYKL